MNNILSFSKKNSKNNNTSQITKNEVNFVNENDEKVNKLISQMIQTTEEFLINCDSIGDLLKISQVVKNINIELKNIRNIQTDNDSYIPLDFSID